MFFKYLRFLRNNRRSVLFAIKAGIASATVYYVSDKGFWKDSAHTEQLYNEISESVAPFTSELKKHIPYELPSLPSSNRVSFMATHYWNKTVLYTFQFLSNVPNHIENLTAQGVDKILSNTEIKTFMSSDVEVKTTEK